MPTKPAAKPAMPRMRKAHTEARRPRPANCGSASPHRASETGSTPVLRVFRQHRQLFAQVELRAQFLHRGLTRPHQRRSLRRQQPFRQRSFADVRARRREQFEKRRLAEEIEILSVGMRRIQIALLRFRRAPPTRP